LEESLACLYNEVKNSTVKVNLKFKALLRKRTIPFSVNENSVIKRYINLNQNKDEKIIPFKIKFLGEDLLIYNCNPKEFFKNEKKEISINHRKLEEALLNKINKAHNAKYSVYFYRLKNLILPDSLEKNGCEVELILEGVKVKYYLLETYFIDQAIEFLFAQYSDLEDFYKVLYIKSKAIERLFFLNNRSGERDNYRLIQSIECFKQPQRKFTKLKHFIELKKNKSIKLQTLSKPHLDDDNYLFLKRLYDACKLNNFLKNNIFPVNNIYNHNYLVILEYSNDDYIIKYDEERNSYSVITSNIDDSKKLREEVLKFKRLVNMLNKKEDITYLFQLIQAKGLQIYSKNS